MERICQQKTGLFPSPTEIEFSCSCPDWASMCKHVAAVLYGIGARLDHQPERLFPLRRVNENDLIAQAGSGLPLTQHGPKAEKVLSVDSLSDLFGLEIASDTPDEKPVDKPAAKPKNKPTGKPVPSKKTVAKKPAKPRSMKKVPPKGKTAAKKGKTAKK